MNLPRYMLADSEEYWFFRKWDESGLAVALAGVDVKRFRGTKESDQLRAAINGTRRENVHLNLMMISWMENSDE